MEQIEWLKPSLRKRQKRRDKRLDKELIECYRLGWRVNEKRAYKNKMKRNQYDHAKKSEGMRSMYRYQKSFNDNLQPLERFLNRKVGKNWNKIHSSLCAAMKKNTVSGLHVFNHLYDFVYEDVIIKDKKVYHLKSGKYRELYSTERFPKFYINQKTGQLMKARLVTNKEFRENKELWQN